MKTNMALSSRRRRVLGVALILFQQFNHPSGFFTRLEAQWSAQQNENPDLADDSFGQLHAWIGYRFWRQRGEATLGVLNLTDQSYELNPLSPFLEPPRRRTFYSALRLSF